MREASAKKTEHKMGGENGFLRGHLLPPFVSVKQAESERMLRDVRR